MAAQGGLNPNVNVDLIGKTSAAPWSRSLFNGLAQVIVQSTRNPGEFKLIASADGLRSASSVVQTQPCAGRHTFSARQQAEREHAFSESLREALSEFEPFEDGGEVGWRWGHRPELSHF